MSLHGSQFLGLELVVACILSKFGFYRPDLDVNETAKVSASRKARYKEVFI